MFSFIFFLKTFELCNSLIARKLIPSQIYCRPGNYKSVLCSCDLLLIYSCRLLSALNLKRNLSNSCFHFRRRQPDRVSRGQTLFFRPSCDQIRSFRGSYHESMFLLNLKDECDSLLRCESDLARRLVLRPLTPSDLPDVRAICAASFPIKYPDCWYEEVVSGSLISHGLFDGSRLAAIMVSETKKILHCNAEDREILADASSHVVYILSLAVNIEYRRSGLASRLLNHLLDTIIENPPYPRAVFLHVLSTNLAAISFYKTNGFIHHDTLLNYYRLESGYGDGFTFVRYTNGARPPMSFNTLCRMLGEAVCFPVKKLCRFFSYS